MYLNKLLTLNCFWDKISRVSISIFNLIIIKNLFCLKYLLAVIEKLRVLFKTRDSMTVLFRFIYDSSSSFRVLWRAGSHNSQHKQNPDTRSFVVSPAAISLLINSSCVSVWWTNECLRFVQDTCTRQSRSANVPHPLHISRPAERMNCCGGTQREVKALTVYFFSSFFPFSLATKQFSRCRNVARIYIYFITFRPM